MTAGGGGIGFVRQSPESNLSRFLARAEVCGGAGLADACAALAGRGPPPGARAPRSEGAVST